MKGENYIKLEFPSKSTNEAFARTAAAAFAAQLDPTMEELGDIKTAVSEAVTNAIVHAYPDTLGTVAMRLRILEEVERRLPGFPIVLHGASSVMPEYVQMINTYGGNMPGAQGVPEDLLRKAASMAESEGAAHQEGHFRIKRIR